jgi:hypothetical protein
MDFNDRRLSDEQSDEVHDTIETMQTLIEEKDELRPSLLSVLASKSSHFTTGAEPVLLHADS